jgi:hypothetical protein
MPLPPTGMPGMAPPAPGQQPPMPGVAQQPPGAPAGGQPGRQSAIEKAMHRAVFPQLHAMLSALPVNGVQYRAVDQALAVLTKAFGGKPQEPNAVPPALLGQANRLQQFQQGQRAPGAQPPMGGSPPMPSQGTGGLAGMLGEEG